MTTRSGSYERQDDITKLQEIVEKLVDEQKQLKEKVEEALLSNDFINEKFEENKTTTEKVLKKLTEISEQNQKLIEKNELLEKQLKIEKEERIKLEERLYTILNPIELEKRYNNLELHGLAEKENENCQEIVNEIIKKITPKPVVIENCYRTGYKFKLTGERNNRAILVKFQKREDRDTAFASRSNLKTIENQTLYLNVNLPPYLKMLRGKANVVRKQKGYKYL